MSLHIRSLLYVSTLSACLLASVGAFAQEPSVQDLYRTSYQLEASGNPRAAVEKMRLIRAKAGASYFVSARTAWLLYVAGDFEASSAAYREAATAAPQAIEPRLGLTLPLMAGQKWRDLERACRDVLRMDANHAMARARLAHALYMVGNYPDSAALYRKLVEEYPAELDHQTGLGWALTRMGRVAEAKVIFGKVLAVSPDNANAKSGMTL